VEYQSEEGTPSSSFGATLAISDATTGPVSFIGAHRDDTDGPDAGAIQIYRFLNDTWTPEQVLRSPAPHANAYFGRAIDVQGDVAIVGESNEHVSTDSGSAFIYRFVNDPNDPNNPWTLEEDLTSQVVLTEGEHFGSSVALDESGTVAVVGAFTEGDWAGAAYVFRDNGLGQWLLESRLTDEGPEEWFGYDVAISQDVLVVAASRPQTAGAAFVFQHSGNDWLPTQKLTVPASDGDLKYGRVAVSGDLILLGGQKSDNDAGATFLYCRNGGGDWDYRYKIAGPTGSNAFGWSVDLSGDRAVVGTRYPVSAFAYLIGCSSVVSSARLLPSDATTDFGFDVAFDGTTGKAVVGSELADVAYWFAGIGDQNANGSLDICEGCGCPGDTNDDCVVNISDLGDVLASFGACMGNPIFIEGADLDGTGCVDISDLGLVLQYYGSICDQAWLQNPSNGHYYILTNSGTWNEAEAEAVAAGGHLVTVNDATENQWLLDTFGDENRWIGLHQPAGSSEPDGGWTWSSGESVTYTNWCSSEPNDDGGEHWAEMKGWASYCFGRWNDLGPTNVMRGIIERN
jgi:hypothetical protein